MTAKRQVRDDGLGAGARRVRDLRPLGEPGVDELVDVVADLFLGVALDSRILPHEAGRGVLHGEHDLAEQVQLQLHGVIVLRPQEVALKPPRGG